MSIVYDYIKNRQLNSLTDTKFVSEYVFVSGFNFCITQLIPENTNVYVNVTQRQYNIIMNIVRIGIAFEHTDYEIIENIRRVAKLHFSDIALISIDNGIEVIFCG